MKFFELSGGTSFQMGKGDSRHVVSPAVGATQITLNYSVFEPGQEFPQHIHDESEDIFIVLNGGVSVRQGERYTPIRAGDAVWIPAGEVHGTVNTTDRQARLISFQSPPDMALYRGERDSSRGKPPEYDHRSESKVVIRRMDEQPQASGRPGTWRSVFSTATGSLHLALDHIELSPNEPFEVRGCPGESVYVVVGGSLTAYPESGATVHLDRHGVIFAQRSQDVRVVGGPEGAVLLRASAITARESKEAGIA